MARGRTLGQIHYRPDGSFRFKNPKPGLCALCKSNSEPLVYDVGALAPYFLFCKECIVKEGAANLRRDSNIALRDTKAKQTQINEDLQKMMLRYVERFGTTMRQDGPFRRD